MGLFVSPGRFFILNTEGLWLIGEMNNNVKRNLLGERVVATWRDLIEQMAALSAAAYAYDEMIKERAELPNPWVSPANYKREPSA